MKASATRTQCSKRPFFRTTFVLVVCVSAVASGCVDAPTVPLPSSGEVTAEMLTGTAQSAFRSNGRFEFPKPILADGDLPLEIARQQALGFARYSTNNVLLRGTIEEGRGGYWTDPHLLTLCSDWYFVRPQLEIPQVLDAPTYVNESYTRRFGSQWLIPLCGADNEPQMTVQIAVRGNEIRFVDGEPVNPYSSLSTAYFGRGVPLNWPDALPISAERAVRFVYDAFGVRISEIPELFFRGDVLVSEQYVWFQIGSARHCNRWRIVLAEPVRMRRALSQTETSTKEVFVSSLSCFHDISPVLQLPTETQPTDAIIDYYDDSVNPARRYSSRIGVAAPLRFELVTKGAPR